MSRSLAEMANAAPVEAARAVPELGSGTGGRDSLSSNIVYSVGGQSVFLLTQLLVLSSLAHLRGLEDVGQLGLALAIATPLFVLCGNGLRVLQSVDAVSRFTFAEYLGTRILGATVAAAATLAIAALFAGTLNAGILVAVTCMRFAEAMSETCYGTFQRLEKLGAMAQSNILRGLLGAAFFYLLLINDAPTAVALCAQVVVWSAVALLLDFPRAARLAAGRLVVPAFRLRKNWIMLSAAFAPSAESLVVNLQKSGQRAIVAAITSLSSLGVFTAIDYLQQAGMMLANAISHALLGRLAFLGAEARHRSAQRIVAVHAGVMLVIGLCGVAAAILLKRELVFLLLGIRSAEAETLLVLIAITVAIRIFTTAPSASLYASGWFGRTLTVQIGATVMATVASLLLVSRFGLIGAGYAMIVAAGFRSACILVLYWRSRPAEAVRG